MKSILSAALILTSGIQALAMGRSTCGLGTETNRNLLLACSFEMGFTTEASVFQKGQSLILKEKNVSGEESCRLLSKNEWDSQKIRLKANDPKARAYILNSKGSWNYYYRSKVYNEVSPASCLIPN